MFSGICFFPMGMICFLLLPHVCPSKPVANHKLIDDFPMGF